LVYFHKGGGWCKICRKKYYKDNKSEINTKSKTYYEVNKENHKEISKQYYKDNKSEINKYHQGYYQDNKSEIYIKMKIRKKNSYHTDPVYKLKSNLQSRIYSYLKHGKKLHRSIKYLGCTIEEYKQYLEQKFDENMNWSNHGNYWEIDHIDQLCTFDMTKQSEQFKAFNYRNTRPLKKSENRSRPKH